MGVKGEGIWCVGRGGFVRVLLTTQDIPPSPPIMLWFFWPFLLILAPVASFLDREKGLHFFTLPELRSPLHHHLVSSGYGRSKWRALSPSQDGAFPEVHDSHEFVGATALGFITLNFSTIVKRTTIQTDDVSSGPKASPRIFFLLLSFMG
jgi:hypothetical protein